MITTKKETRLIEKRCKECEHNHTCWQDFEVGVWRKKDLKCDDIRDILEGEQDNELRENDYKKEMRVRDVYFFLLLLFSIIVFSPWIIMFRLFMDKVRGY